MAIVVTLSPELEALLRDRAAQQGQDVSFVASELLAGVLEWEEKDSEEAISDPSEDTLQVHSVCFWRLERRYGKPRLDCLRAKGQ